MVSSTAALRWLTHVNKCHENKNNENAAMDFDNCVLVSATLCTAFATLMHEYDDSATAIGHYFKKLFHTVYFPSVD